MRLKLVLAALASILMIAGAHAQDGARAYYPLPAGTNDIDLTLTLQHTEASGGMFDSAVFTPSYRHTFDVAGDAVTFLIGLPVGALSAAFGPVTFSNNPAQGDLFVGATVGVIGAPALTPMEYAQFQPGLAVNVSTRLFLPTGDYDATRVLNIGGNRWSLQTSLPISYVLGGSLIDPQVTTLELVPSVQIFGDNAATSTSQAPVFGVEAHVTHSFNHAVWAAIDGFATSGGETTVGGVAQGNAQQAVSVGATLGLVFSQSVSTRLSYEEQVYSKGPVTASRRFMATTAFLF